VDNASQDDTRAYLETLPLGARIFNRDNFGCGVAWNQGALALQADWTIVMNNDVVVTAGWLEGLLARAESLGLKVVSPALIEGSLDYDLEAFAADARARMGEELRRGGRHAVCMAIHRSVWNEIGYFRATPKLWGYEDTLFFNDVERAGLPTAILGSSWLHHYGSITLAALKQERGLSKKQGLSARNSYTLLGQSTLARKFRKWRQMFQAQRWRETELARHGITLHGERHDGQFIWR
jgi:GT2 family glycosyltransferase